MFVILFGYFIYQIALVPGTQAMEGFSENLERDFRAMQAVTLAGVFALILYFRIDVGRNLRGIIAGIGLYVGSTILSETLRGYAGPSLDAAWKIIQPYTYLLALAIWTFTLWSYAPAPLPEAPVETHTDYDALARSTQEALETMRASVKKAEQP
jgi:hypothetical protein